jgi:ParB-like chromosome segregation protein Spo0J
MMAKGGEEKGTFLDISLSEIGESHGRLRLIHPKAEASMVESLGKFGQLSPVVVAMGEMGRYELIDGFKRVRALKRLGVERVRARWLEVNVRVQKAAMIYLNWKKGAISDLEEGMVVHSLCREDGLSQVEVSVLLGRHKSWVCRRLSLIERLCDEALEHVRLGLIPTSIGRELCRLPRGNQQRALRTILKYRLCSRESARLVSLLLKRPGWDWETILNFPEEILYERTGVRPPGGRFTPMARALVGKLLDIKQCLSSIAHPYSDEVLLEFIKEGWPPIYAAVEGIDRAFKEFRDGRQG